VLHEVLQRALARGPRVQGLGAVAHDHSDRRERADSERSLRAARRQSVRLCFLQIFPFVESSGFARGTQSPRAFRRHALARSTARRGSLERRGGLALALWRARQSLQAPGDSHLQCRVVNGRLEEPDPLAPQFPFACDVTPHLPPLTRAESCARRAWPVLRDLQEECNAALDRMGWMPWALCPWRKRELPAERAGKESTFTVQCTIRSDRAPASQDSVHIRQSNRNSP
jgi:hypothetical protein